MLSIQEIDHNMICFETKTLKEINTLSNIINSLSNKSDDSISILNKIIDKYKNEFNLDTSFLE